MTRIERVLHEVAAALRAEGAPFALIGGLAVSARSEPRFTRDVDWAVAVADDAAAEALVNRLVQSGYVVVMTVEQNQTNRLATVRFLPPGEPEGGVVADLLFASSGIEPELVAAADAIEIFPGLVVAIAKTGHLIALKVLSAAPDRPQDQADLRALSRVASGDDLELARQALELIEVRGFARGKDLIEEFARLMSAGG